MKQTKEYYYIEINLENMKIVNWGITPNATLTGETDKKEIFRVFLTKGQYNKLVAKTLGK